MKYADLKAGRGMGLALPPFWLTPPNGWRGGLVGGVLNAESIPRTICQALLKGGVGAV